MRTPLLSQILVVLMVASCRQMAPSNDGATAACKELDVLHAQLDSLYRQGDAPGVAKLLTDSVIISPIEAPDLQGREPVEAILADFFTNYTVAQYLLQLKELDVFGDAAYGRGTFTWQAGPHGEDAKTTYGRFAAVYRRGADGQWRLHRLLENAMPTATP